VGYDKLDYKPIKIAHLCNVSLKCVNNTLRNYKKNGGVRESPRSGRLRITSPREDKELIRLSRRSPDALLRELNQS
jgi:hypothetical protein